MQFGRKALISQQYKYSDSEFPESSYNTLNPRAARGVDPAGARQGSRLQRREGSMLRNAGHDVVFSERAYDDKAYETRGRQDNRSAISNSQLAGTADESPTTLISPLFGFSEGEAKKQQFARAFKEYYEKSQKSSVSRSRSRSKKERLIDARREAEMFKDEGIVG